MDFETLVEVAITSVQDNEYRAESRIYRLKRAVDVILGIVCLLISLPLMLLVGLMVKLDSPGPALYRSSRLGRGGVIFKMWKFRTMVDGADEVLLVHLAENPDAQVEWDLNQKLKNDPRVTRLGRILRKLSLDELPQFWNVILGDMSLVGPRPIVIDEIHHYGERLHWYTNVRPGLTGLWQVSGRNNLSSAMRVALDEYYVRNWSIWLDIKILLRTGWVVLRGDGAY